MPPPDDHRTRPDFTIPFDAAAPESGAPPASLKAGHVLAGRYRVVRFIAQGGMGEVWEAADLELPGEHVALKTIRPAIAHDAWAMGRFRREIQLGRRITHPNVCRIFDLFHHRPGAAGGEPGGGPAAGPDTEITFLTMELLTGETLEDRLDRGGRMSLAEALPVVRQMAAALQAAHELEIIHGDFKASNVMLLGAGETLRAVVTDFGLARGGGSAAGLMTSVPAGDKLIGTPAYMAPEQVRGARSSVAADIYSLGIVMFEMVTGRLPFQAETAVSSAVMRLTEPPPPPRSLVPDIDPRWEATVLRCLALEPGDRFARSADVARALEPDAPIPKLPETARLAARRWKTAGVAAAILAAGLAIGLGIRQRSASNGPSHPGQSLNARPAIAVLGFQNTAQRPDAAWLSTAISEMLASELGAGNQFRVIPAENVARMRVELDLGDFSTLAGDTLERVRAILGTDLVVLGSYTVVGAGDDAPISLNVSYQDVAAGGTVPIPPRAESKAKLFDLVRAVGGDLRSALGVESPPEATVRSALAAYSAKPEAARLYAEGLAQLRRFDHEAARAVLLQALEVDPQQPMAHAALAAAWSAAGYDTRAIAEAKQAFDLSRGLPLEQRLEVEGRYREIASEWPEAIKIYGTLFGNYPDNLDYGLRLANAQIAGGQAAAANATIAVLRALPAPAGKDPRLDLAAAQAADSLSDFAAERDAARRAAAAGQALGARLLVAHARLAESWALRNLDDPLGATAAAEEAKSIYAAAGDRAGAARAVNQLGIVAWQSGAAEDAARLYEEARIAFEALGDRRGVAQALNNQAILRWQQGDLPGARGIYERVAAIHRETGSRRYLASTLNNVGIVLKGEGRLDDAFRTHSEALQIRREIGEQQGQATSLVNLAQVVNLRGDPTGAAALATQALAIFRELGSKAGTADALINIAGYTEDRDPASAAASFREAVALKRELEDSRGLAIALSGLSDMLRVQGQLAEARPPQEEALRIRRELGDRGRPFASELGLAWIALYEGDIPAAQRLAQAAREGADAVGEAETAAEAILVQARSALASNALEAARQLLAAGRAAVDASPALRLAYGIAEAQLRARAGARAGARQSLERLLGEARAAGLPELAFETRLALAEIELAADAAAGRRSAESLRSDAAKAGFGSVASRAALLLEPRAEFGTR